MTFPPFGGLQAIRDGVIEASINHEKGYVQSKEMIDIYSTREPQLAFHQRISFCLDIHNMSVKVRSAWLQRPGAQQRACPPYLWVLRKRWAWFGAQFPSHLSKITKWQRAPGGQRTLLMGLQHLLLLLGGLVAREVQTDSEFRVLDLVSNWSHLPSLSLCFSICEVNGEILPPPAYFSGL